MTPKLPFNPKPLVVVQPETANSTDKLSTRLVQMVKEVEHTLIELESDQRRLQVIRATLIANFGPDGKAGKAVGVTVPTASDRSTIAILIDVLRQLCAKLGHVT